MPKKKTVKPKKITEHVSYSIIGDTIYLFTENLDVKREELNKVSRELSDYLKEENIAYINITGNKIKELKEYYQSLGFTISTYTPSKLNMLYDSKKDKSAYRYYAFISKEEFIASTKDLTKTNSNSGYISNMLLLFGGIALLCYFCVQGAIYLVK